ncbi:hypothetical protein BDW75DRAFT_131550 [Aspergillus navahoensis]
MKHLQFAGLFGHVAWILLFVHVAYFQLPSALAQGLGEPGGTCSDSIPCYQGCCSAENQCGFTDGHCGDGCKHNCNATAECGEFAAPGTPDCPINVCCSEFGYCGVTSDFCGDGCQPNSLGAGCGDPDRPQCTANTNALSYKRRIAYYELFNLAKDCNVVEPENLVLAPFTHINLAFVNFGDDYRIIDTDGDAVDRMSVRKFDNAGLKINIAVGGWAFSDPPTQYLWSEMTSTYPNRQIFITSVVDYLRTYHLDGIDLDWEYPAATDRGGNPDDIPNFINLLHELRETFDREDPGWEISVTLPTSYWYLRGFDLERMEKYVDYFNLMSYDLHGMWDREIQWTGPYLRGHTDIEQIDKGLDLLWRNGIKPEDVVFGLAFYGRSFTMVDSTCHEPNGVCEFSRGGKPGSCSDTEGILTFAEVAARNKTLDVQTFYDPETTVKYNTYGGDQWISYDDEQSFFDKKRFLTERCLSGLMIWAIDQDDGNFNALSGVFGEDIGVLEMSGGGLDDKAKDALADIFGAYTGQDCFVTPRCTDGSSKEKNPDQVCPSGFLSVQTAHNPLQAPGHEHHGDCAEGWYRHICCPRKAMPKDCEWNGAPVRSSFGCDGQCGEGQFKLNQDTALDAKGEGSCFTGHRSLCCKSTDAISRCFWTECQGPFTITELPTCPSGSTYMTYRLDKPNGKPWCSDTFVNVDGFHGWPPHYTMKSALCCPEEQTPRSCSWTNDDFEVTDDEDFNAWDMVCKPRQCPSGTVEFGSALHPATSKAELGASGISCDSISLPSNTDPEFSYCCDPPSKYNKKWPVDPKMLWEHYYNEEGESDVVWDYSNEYEKNNRDSQRAAPGAEDGTDAYGFVMLDGPEGSIDNSFADTQTVVRRSAAIPNVKRSVLTTNRTLLDSVFEHHEETIYVYCNYPVGSRECDRIFIDGAEDTIIRLPDHVGQGPFARVVSMELAHDEYRLPDHHVEHRRSKRNENPVYKVKIDYGFDKILPKRADEPVYIRVDYTNLLDYWSEMTNSPASRMKRGMGEDSLTHSEWMSRVQRAASRDQAVRKRSEKPVEIRTPMDLPRSHSVDRRWWGAFKEWLAKMTTVSESELGVLPLGWARRINLFSANWGCAKTTVRADLNIDLEANFQMDATYAYYLSATFIPPGKPEAFAYFGMQPTAYLGLHMEGNVVFQMKSQRKKIIDTLSYPGLAVKGIAAVGPTLDVYGQIQGRLTLHGEADAGATVSFGKAEVYWPQNDEAKDKYEQLLGLESETEAPAPFSVEPVLRAGVAVDAGLTITVTPEANVGIKIGGGRLVGGATLMDAQLTGYVEGNLTFEAHADYDTDSNEISYSFRTFFAYNLGYKAIAKILNFIDWALDAREAYKPSRRITLYEKLGTIPLSESATLETRAIDGSWGNDTSLAPELVPAGLIRRADGMDLDPEFTKKVTCPKGSSGDPQLPELRINCKYLNDVAEQNTKTGAWVPAKGLCTPILNIDANKRQELFTFSSDDKITRARYKEQCPTGTCTSAQNTLNDQAGKPSSGRRLILQCDEFPQKSSEQGGKYMDSIGPGRRTQTCVPAYQNNWHGQCFKLMGGMKSNWAKLDPELDAQHPRKEYWVAWGATAWTSQGEYGPENSKYEQRLKEYDTEQPPPDKVQTRPNTKYSWAFKRDYKISWMQQDTISSTDWWDSTGWKYQGSTYKAPRGADSILCAVNTFGQDDVYRYATLDKAETKSFNGYCFYEESEATNYNWAMKGGVTPCLVDFAAPSTSGASAKREWVVTNVTLLEVSPEDSQDQ